MPNNVQGTSELFLGSSAHTMWEGLGLMAVKSLSDINCSVLLGESGQLRKAGCKSPIGIIGRRM